MNGVMWICLVIAAAATNGPRLFTPGAQPYVVHGGKAASTSPAGTVPVAFPTSTTAWRESLARQPRIVASAGMDWLAVYRSSTVQKTLELVVMTAFGVWARTKLTSKDAGVIQKFLLVTITPCVIFTSLCKIKVGLDSLGFVLGGVGIVLLQQLVAHTVAYTVFGFNTSKMNQKTQDLRRTAATEMATMAPAASAFAFITEYVGAMYTGLAALMDLPMKVYILILMRYVLKAKGRGESITTSSEESGNPGKMIVKQLTDPFNASIIGGVLCSILFKGQAIANLGFAGSALETLAAAQTPVLFLLIGLKLSIDGATPSLCGVLLLLRHGLVMLFVKTFFILSGIASLQTQLLIILSSQASNALIGLAQINAAKNRGVQGYSSDFAFDIICISYPMTILLNTVACVGGSAFIANMFPIGGSLIALSGLLYTVSKDKIAESLDDPGTELAVQ
jgi:predicted permease